MARDRATRLREFEQMEKQTSVRRRYATERRRPLGINTMEPPEELVERRRHRSHVTMAATNNTTRNVLLENVILLVMLTASIYGLYRLAMYILNQA